MVYADRVEARWPGGGIRRIPRDQIKEVRGESGAFRARTRVLARLTGGADVSLVTSYNFRAWFSEDPWDIYEQWPHRVAEAVTAHLDLAS